MVTLFLAIGNGRVLEEQTLKTLWQGKEKVMLQHDSHG
jgi:hypothetical protein